MTVLEGLKPEKVFYFFEKLCEIPLRKKEI